MVRKEKESIRELHLCYLTIAHLLAFDNMHFKFRIFCVSFKCTVFKLNPWDFFNLSFLVFLVLDDKFFDQV